MKTSHKLRFWPRALVEKAACMLILSFPLGFKRIAIQWKSVSLNEPVQNLGGETMLSLDENGREEQENRSQNFPFFPVRSVKSRRRGGCDRTQSLRHGIPQRYFSNVIGKTLLPTERTRSESWESKDSFSSFFGSNGKINIRPRCEMKCVSYLGFTFC